MVGLNLSTELNPLPKPYTSSSEQVLSFNQTVFGYSNYNNSAPQLLLEPASTSPFQLAGQLDTYHANSSSNEFDLSPTTYAQSNPASPSSVQYLGAPEEYSSPGYTQIPDADHSLYNSLMFNSSPMQDNGYAPQPGTENVYYGLENGHLWDPFVPSLWRFYSSLRLFSPTRLSIVEDLLVLCLFSCLGSLWH